MNIITGPLCMPAAATRVLAVLAEPGAFARRSPLDDRKLALFRTRKGMTLGAGLVQETDCAALVDAGLVAWTRIGAHRHLVICAAGLAARHHGSRPDQRSGQDPESTTQSSQPVTVNLRESPLAWLHRRKTRNGEKQISDIQFTAGERLRFNLERGQMLPRVTANWSSPVSGTSGAPGSASDSALAARERVGKACSAVGPEFSGLLIDVCGFLKGLEQVESERGWPARSGKLLLRMGLDRLARHYGLTRPGPVAATKARSEVWHAADARPTLLPTVSLQQDRQVPDGHRS
jgi:Domain of unknown function (DUF6456)